MRSCGYFSPGWMRRADATLLVLQTEHRNEPRSIVSNHRHRTSLDPRTTRSRRSGSFRPSRRRPPLLFARRGHLPSPPPLHRHFIPPIPNFDHTLIPSIPSPTTFRISPFRHPHTQLTPSTLSTSPIPLPILAKTPTQAQTPLEEEGFSPHLPPFEWSQDAFSSSVGHVRIFTLLTPKGSLSGRFFPPFFAGALAGMSYLRLEGSSGGVVEGAEGGEGGERDELCCTEVLWKGGERAGRDGG